MVKPFLKKGQPNLQVEAMSVLKVYQGCMPRSLRSQSFQTHWDISINKATQLQHGNLIIWHNKKRTVWYQTLAMAEKESQPNYLWDILQLHYSMKQVQQLE